MPEKKTRKSENISQNIQEFAEKKSMTRIGQTEQSDPPAIARTDQPSPPTRTRGRGGTGNFPNAANDKPEDARRILSEVLAWYRMPRANTDDEIAERTELFFNTCASKGERPTVEKFCVALGYARNTVNEWKNGMHCSAFRSNIIKRSFEVLAAYDAGMATEGKMNPVPYIFRAKNYYGMKDQTDLVVTPNNPLGDTITAEEIEQKYQELPED